MKLESIFTLLIVASLQSMAICQKEEIAKMKNRGFSKSKIASICEPSSKWITPTVAICKAKGGELDSEGICNAPLKQAQSICKASGGRLPTLKELKMATKECGGRSVISGDDNSHSIIDDNLLNVSYQSCYKTQGFTENEYWSSTPNRSARGFVWNIHIVNGVINSYEADAKIYVRCIRVK